MPTRHHGRAPCCAPSSKAASVPSSSCPCSSLPSTLQCTSRDGTSLSSPTCSPSGSSPPCAHPRCAFASSTRASAAIPRERVRRALPDPECHPPHPLPRLPMDQAQGNQACAQDRWRQRVGRCLGQRRGVPNGARADCNVQREGGELQNQTN